MPRTLPLIADGQGSVRHDGTRYRIYPGDVRGPYVRARRILYLTLIACWAVLPWLRIGGNPALFLDVEGRRFFILGQTFNAQDTWLLFFLATGVAFLLMTMTALLGRVFCGWACPQTVFLEGVFRRLERILEGPRETRIRRDTGPWTTGKLGRKILLHTAYLVASFGIAHIFLSYFVSVPGALAMMKGSPREHLEAFVWAMGMTAFFYANFAWFREQMCLVVCPYGRLQAVLVDNHTLSVGYDSLRGEPRRVRGPGVQQPQQGNHGDCVDCRRCIAVCPTGIDIRNGPQLDCIGCTGCIDACDEIMGNLGRPAGLIRYDSLEGFAGKPSHFLRSRTLFYGAALLVGALAAGLAFARRTPYEANLLRIPGPPFTEVDGYVQNVFEVHVASKAAEAQTIRLTSESFGPNTTIVMPIHEVHLSPLSSQRLPVLVRVPKAQFTQEFDLRIRVSPVSGDGHGKLLMGRVLGAKS